MADDVNDAQRPFKNIEAEAERVLRKHGLKSMHTHWEMESPLVANIMVINDPDYVKPTGDPEFDKIIADAEKAEQEQRVVARADKARKELEELRGSLGKPEDGIGLD